MTASRNAPATAAGRPAAGDAVSGVRVVVPVYRNADTLPALHRRVTETLGVDLRPGQLIFVNDGCDAGSGEVLRELERADDSVEVVDLEANRGQHAAVLAGLERSRGEWTVVLDADLQDPPEAIPRLIAAASPGTEAVFAGRRGSYESRPRLLTGRAYRGLLRLVAGTPYDAGIYVALSRRMVERLLEMRAAMPARSPAIVAMIGCTRLGTASVPVERAHRPAGGSAYSSRRRLRSGVQALAWATAWRLHERSPERVAGGWRRRGRSGAKPDVERHNASQRRYFERGLKSTMVPRESRYLNRHLDELLLAARIRPGDRVLEVGCGMGRYTLPLAERGIQVEGLDISPLLLDRLAGFNTDGHEIPLHCADVLSPPEKLIGRYDAVIGLFALHHLHDVPASLRSMARLLRDGGSVGFCEPNPYNPLYYVQIAARPGMTWAGDGGIVEIRRRPMMRALAAAGFGDLHWRRFGFFPPFLTDSPLRGLEPALEGFPLWRGALPFQVFGGRLTGAAG